MELINHAAEYRPWDGHGDGFGDGDGDGSGYGTVYGYGTGYGTGYGSGYGSGYGTWYGSGDWSGDGFGEGSGYGYGYGDGDGGGKGEGDGSYWFAVAEQSLSENARAFELNRCGAAIAFWRSTKDGFPANGGKAWTAAYVGKVDKVKGPLGICTHNALHATLLPPKWEGEKIWIVAMYPPFVVDDDKIGSLKREILAEAGFSL